jgi:hypothetical protein
MKNLSKRFRRKLFALGFACALVAPVMAGVPGGNTNVNVNITTDTVNLTEVNEVFNDVILESLWEIVGKAERRNIWDTSQPPEFWEIEVTVSEADFATALADVKTQLEDLTEVPGRKFQYFEIQQDEQTGERLDQVSQSYEEVQTGQDTSFEETIDNNGAVLGVDYIAGDPNDFSTWVAIGQNDVNVDVNQVTTTTTFLDAVTTTEFNSVAVWTVSALRTISPILLDMDGDGAIQASGGKWLPHREPDRSRMAFFDFHGDRFPVLMEWPGPDDGILCEPEADGSIDGTNLFGTATGFSNGYEALRAKDSNNDGKLNGAELNGLAVWTDMNSDARPQTGEVKGLAEHQITELSVKHKNFVASFVKNGESERMFDWWPQTYELNRVRLMPKKT